jgi:hypothetical protein
MERKILLWTVICFIGFNLIVSKAPKDGDNLAATMISFIVGPLIGVLVFKLNKPK